MPHCERGELFDVDGDQWIGAEGESPDAHLDKACEERLPVTFRRRVHNMEYSAKPPRAQFSELGGRRIDDGDSRWPGSSGRTPALRTLWTQAACTVLGRPRHPCALP